MKLDKRDWRAEITFGLSGKNYQDYDAVIEMKADQDLGAETQGRIATPVSTK